MTKLTLRGDLTPESASYLSALPPSTPPVIPGMQPMSGTCAHWEGISLTAGHGPSEDNLQAQLDALDAGLPPLLAGHGGGNGEGNDFQVRPARPARLP